MDLAIAATANVHKVPLLTENTGDFQIIRDLVDARAPTRADGEVPPADSP
jgi:predicted nucleic acid-binding protein